MSFGLFVKQFITFFVEPYGLVLTLFILGLYFLYTSRQARAKLFLSLSAFLLFLFAYPPFTNFLVSNLENQYAKYDYKTQVEYIHVLGNGHTTDKTQPISSQLSAAGTKRVLEGVIIHSIMPESKIIFTGYSGKTDTTNAVMNSRLALVLGVNAESMIINGKPTDTREEAVFSKTLVGSEPFILVTSATHMPRSMMLFRSFGMNPIAAPTNFYKEDFRGYLRAPQPIYFHISAVAVHEYLGILYAKLRG